jgi:hypothetical protein
VSVFEQKTSCGSNVAMSSIVTAFSIASTAAIDPSLRGAAAQSSFILQWSLSPPSRTRFGAPR